MPLQKIQFKPGVDRDTTRYNAEGTWYETDKVRFRRGMPQKIGGWERISSSTFLGVCRSMFNWVTLGGQNLVSVGTNIKYYIERGGAYYDSTPYRLISVAGDATFAAVDGDATITVTEVAHGAVVGSYVTFSGAVSLGGNITAAVLNQNYLIATVVDTDNFTVEAVDTSGATVLANASDTGNGGASTVASYEIAPGADYAVPFAGWGAGTWGASTWGSGATTTANMRLWSQANFGEDLILADRGGNIYIWDASVGAGAGAGNRATFLTAAVGQSNVPTIVNYTTVSDIFRFVFCFGSNPLGSSILDPMLIRWSDQEDAINWTPQAINQAGSLRLSNGSKITTALQARQEMLVWTDAALYGMQYLGAPEVWGANLLGSNLTIASQNAAIIASDIAYWMGKDKFYIYDGVVKTLPCSIRSYIFDDFNLQQTDQVICGTNERFNEVWWFYCSSGSTTADRYAIYNYGEDAWAYGNMARTAWLDADLRDFPLAATYSNNLVKHEVGYDNKETASVYPITATLVSAEFDLDDGDRAMFISRVLPDVTFTGSTASSPAVTMTISPMANSGAGYNSPLSEGGNSSATVTRTAIVPIEEFTGQAFVRVRGRQMSFKVESTAEGVAWKLGATRFDMRPDGGRG
tara:strand:- start:450 stop:2351 length:1902 start_codon:yes stop_codon:yes gene_type:complete